MTEIAVSLDPATAAIIARAMNAHLVMLETSGPRASLDAELANLLNHDDDMLDQLALNGCIGFVRTAREDAETLYADMVRNRTTNPNSALAARVVIYAPDGTQTEWNSSTLPHALAA